MNANAATSHLMAEEVRTMRTPTEPVRVHLVVPGSASHLRLARLTASGVVAIYGVQISQLDRVRTVVDAIAASLLEIGQGHPLKLDFLIWRDTLQVRGSTEQSPAAADRLRRFPVNDMVLNLLTSRHRLIRSDGEAMLTAEIPLGER